MKLIVWCKGDLTTGWHGDQAEVIFDKRGVNIRDAKHALREAFEQIWPEAVHVHVATEAELAETE